MVVYYEKLYRTKGLRRIEHFLKPRVLDAKQFAFPIGSSLHIWKVSNELEYFKNDYAIFNYVEKAQVRTIFEYTREQGKFIKKAFLVNGYITENKKLVKNFKFLKPDQEITCTDRVLKVAHSYPINSRYKYMPQPLLPYVKYKNVFNTVIDNLFIFPNRRVFLYLEIPNQLLTRIELNKYMKRLTNGSMDFFKSYKDFTVLELWKFLTPEFRNESLFNSIPRDRYKDVDLLLAIDNKLILLNMQAFAACIEEYGVIYPNIKARSANQFKKMFYIMLKNFIETPAMSESELETLEKAIDKDPNAVLKQAEEKEEDKNITQKVEVNESQLPNTNKIADTTTATSLTDVISKLKSNKNNNGVIKKDKKEDKDVVDEATEQSMRMIEEDDDYEEIMKRIESHDNKIGSTLQDLPDLEDLDDDIEESEDEPTLLDKKINENEKNISEDDELFLPTLDEINLEEYKFDNVLTKIDNLLENKVLNKQQSAKLKEILVKQQNQKDPYGSGKTLKEVFNIESDNLTLNSDKTKINNTPAVFDERYNNNVTNVLRKDYIENQYKKDIIRSVYALQNYNLIVENYEINSVDDPMGKLDRHKITFKTLDNKSHTVHVNLPQLENDGTISLNNQTYICRYQRNNLPISKIDLGSVKLSSYYGKMFIYKAFYKKNDIGYSIMNQLAKRYENGEDIKDLIMLSSNNEEIKLPLDYSHFSRYIKAFKFKGIQFNFEYKNRAKLFKGLSEESLNMLEESGMVLIGNDRGIPLLIDFNNNLYKFINGKYEKQEDIFTLLNISKDELPIEYSVAKIYKKQIPVVILLSYYYGLTNLLKILKLKYQFIEVNKRVSTNTEEIVIKFSDKKLIVKRDNGLGDMIISGLIELQKVLKDLPYKVLNSKNDFMVLCNKLDYGILYINEIKMLETLFVDPITLSILKANKLPTSFKGILIEASKLLLDDNYINPNNLKGMCIKGYERIAGMLYYEMIKSLKEYEGKSMFSRAKFNISPYCITSTIQEDSTTVLVDDLNPIAALKQTEDVSYLGALGFNKDALAKDSRIYNKSEVGVISESVKDSGDVGITAYMSASPKLKNLRGEIDNFDTNQDGPASIYSTSALLAPFGLTDDTKRLNFSGIQNSHVIPIKNMKVPYVRTGYEAVIPVRSSDKFVISAEEDGIVTKVTTSSIEVEYKTSKKKKSYKLKEWTTKEESDVCYTHKLVTNFKIGDKFKKDDSLVYDKLFFEPDIFNPNRVIYKQGSVVTVALMENIETYEDSGAISSKLVDELSTEVTKVKSIIVNATDNIVNMKSVGSKLDTDDILFSIIGDMVIPENINKEVLESLKALKTQSPKAKIRGTISKIEIRYNCKINELSKTLQELVIASDKRLKTETGYTGEILNNNYTIKGQALQPNQVEIKVYITCDNPMGIGDKGIFGNQLKFTVGEVFDGKIEGEDGTEVDAKFSYKSISARIVNSPILMGTCGMVLEKLTKKAVDLYFK